MFSFEGQVMLSWEDVTSMSEFAHAQDETLNRRLRLLTAGQAKSLAGNLKQVSW